MPTIPEPLLRQDYAGLNSAESDILRQYLRDQDPTVERLQTQIKVAPGELAPESRPDALRRQWRESSKFKIDAVVTTSSEIQLLELKDLARTSALGQLLCYRYWYELERDPEKPLSLHCACPEVNPGALSDMGYIAQCAQRGRVCRFPIPATCAASMYALLLP